MNRKDFIESLRRKARRRQAVSMAGKRVLSVTVKLSADDWKQLSKAAEERWPQAIMSKSSIILSLAKIGAERAGKGKV